MFLTFYFYNKDIWRSFAPEKKRRYKTAADGIIEAINCLFSIGFYNGDSFLFSNRIFSMNHRRYKTAADGIIGTFLFVYSLFSQTHTVRKIGRSN